MNNSSYLDFFLLPATLVRFIIGLAAIVLVIALAVSFLMNYQRTWFNVDATKAIGQVNEKLITNDAALSGFASLLKTIGVDSLQATREYTKRIREAYPHIYMFEAMVSVDPAKKADHEVKMHQAGYPNYKITRYVSKKNPQGKPFNTIEGVPMHYPIFFIDPYLDSVKGLMGFDMLSARKMREPLLASLAHGETVASEPYKLREGGRGYVLVKAVDTISADGPSYQDGGLTAALMIKTDAMMASLSEMVPYASVKLMYGEGQKLAAEIILPQPNTTPMVVLKTLTTEHKFDDFGQPFTLVIERKTGLYTADIIVICLFIIFMCFGYWLFYRGKFAKYCLKLQRDAAVVELGQQHHKLEVMVARRTQELQRKSDENTSLSQQLIRVQEDQYQHIARELHDEFGQTLTAIKINAHIIQSTESTDNVELYAEEITAQADALYEAMRNMIQRLRPEALDMFGLKIAIEQCILAFHLDEQNIQLELDIDDAVNEMAEIYSIASYRVVQELVNNAVKYSNSTMLKVRLGVWDNQIHIIVHDNGIGFDPVKNKAGFGLLGVEERTRALAGFVDITTSRNAGVRVHIQIPLQENGFSL